MTSLTADELRRVQATLYNHFPTGARNDIRSVGFGQAMEAGEPDPNRPFAACVVVKRKRKRLPATRTIDKVMPVRLRRGGRFVTIDVQTDVIELPELLPGGRFMTELDLDWLRC